MKTANYALILTLMLFTASCQTSSNHNQDRGVALIIGNSEYQDSGISDLPNPISDAKSLAAELRRLEFHVISGTDLSAHEMENHLSQFADAIRSSGIGFIFFAGHGLQINNENYLVPVDFHIRKSIDLRKDLMPLSEVFRVMQRPDLIKLVFLDACRNNPLTGEIPQMVGSGRMMIFDHTDGRGLKRVQKVNTSQGLAKFVDAPENSLIAYATAAGAIAEDGTGRNSPFTTALLRHIREPNLEIGSFLTRVADTVYRETDGRQIPWRHMSLRQDVIMNPVFKPTRKNLLPPM